MVAIMAPDPTVTMVAVAQKAQVMYLHDLFLCLIVLIFLHLPRDYVANLDYFCLLAIMRRHLGHILIVLALFISGETCLSHAQTRYNFDTDIYAIRNSIIPGFHYTYDDWLQYSPAALMVGLKAAGYESRSSWGRMLASDAVSAGIMAIAVNGVKYSVGRLRPDGSRHNSFPSGHTATAFMTATMLHMEYGWRSPWFSIGGYSAAALTGVSRIMNNRHWMTDVMAGAAIGIGSVHLGYYLTDLIFKGKGLSSDYVRPSFQYDPTVKHYVAELLFGRRYIIGAEGLKGMGSLPIRGGLAGISADIPLKPGMGITVRASASSMTYANGDIAPMYSTLAGGFWNFHFARVLEFQTHIMAGYAWMAHPSLANTSSSHGSGLDLAAGISLGLITGSNFKFKTFADFESINISPVHPWLNTAVVGWSSAWFW